MKKDFDGAAWATSHHDDFQALIANARQHGTALKPVEDDRAGGPESEGGPLEGISNGEPVKEHREIEKNSLSTPMHDSASAKAPQVEMMDLTSQEPPIANPDLDNRISKAESLKSPDAQSTKNGHAKEPSPTVVIDDDISVITSPRNTPRPHTPLHNPPLSNVHMQHISSEQILPGQTSGQQESTMKELSPSKTPITVIPPQSPSTSTSTTATKSTTTTSPHHQSKFFPVPSHPTNARMFEDVDDPIIDPDQPPRSIDR